MAFNNIKDSAPKPGKLVSVVLDMLPGRPVVHLEHLGDTNESWTADQIARANSKTSLGFGSRKASKKLLREIVERKRQAIADHAIRDLEAKHSDGTLATKADIPAFTEALPPHVVEMIYDFASNANNWIELPAESEVSAVAGK